MRKHLLKNGETLIVEQFDPRQDGPRQRVQEIYDVASHGAEYTNWTALAEGRYLRRAVEGEFEKTSYNPFFIGLVDGQVVADVGMLAAREAPAIGSLGWVYTCQEHRGKGISSCLTEVALQWFNEVGGVCAHLGTGNPIANHIYAKHGFFDYYHETMRYLRPGVERENYDQKLFANVGPATIRPANWCDASRIACLYASRHPWLIKDYQEGLFCSKSIMQRRYFSVPCSILGRAELNEGAVYVMETSDLRIVGSANINRVDDIAQAHVAQVEFLVHPTHFEQTNDLLAAALQCARDSGASIARTYATTMDEQRIEAADAAGFRCAAILVDQFDVGNHNISLHVYSLDL